MGGGKTKNEDFCIKNEELCIKNEGFCIQMMDFAGGGAEILNTDDVSLQVFMDHLKNLAVTQNQA